MRLALLALLLFATPALAEPQAYTVEDLKLLDSSELTFEPSAAVMSGDGRSVYLFNDKTLDLTPTVWRFDAGEQLVRVPVKPSGLPINKIEGATRSADGVWILTSCSKQAVGDANNFRLLAMSDTPDGGAPVIQVDYSVLFHVALWDLLRAENVAYMKFEGLALAPDQLTLLLGVREIRRVTGEYEKVIGVLEYSLADPLKLTKRLWIADTCEADGRCWGLGTLEFDSRGALWMTANYENETGKKREDVAGRLYRVDLEAGTLGAPVATFETKAEALTFLPDGRMLIVFDEDDDRKKNFGLKSNQDYYLVREP